MSASIALGSALRTGHVFTWSDDLIGRVLPSCRAIFDEVAAHALGVAKVAEQDQALWIPGLTAKKANDLYYGYMTAVDLMPAVELAGKRLCIPFFIAYCSRPMIATHHTAVRVAPAALHELAASLREHISALDGVEPAEGVTEALDALDSFATHVVSVLARLRAIPVARIEALAAMPCDETGYAPTDPPAEEVRPALVFFC